ncbi:hypothetical protein L9F63_002662, partial [Diploptera punctata]
KFSRFSVSIKPKFFTYLSLLGTTFDTLKSPSILFEAFLGCLASFNLFTFLTGSFDFLHLIPFSTSFQVSLFLRISRITKKSSFAYFIFLSFNALIWFSKNYSSLCGWYFLMNFIVIIFAEYNRTVFDPILRWFMGATSSVHIRLFHLLFDCVLMCFVSSFKLRLIFSLLLKIVLISCVVDVYFQYFAFKFVIVNRIKFMNNSPLENIFVISRNDVPHLLYFLQQMYSYASEIKKYGVNRNMKLP